MLPPPRTFTRRGTKDAQKREIQVVIRHQRLSEPFPPPRVPNKRFALTYKARWPERFLCDDGARHLEKSGSGRRTFENGSCPHGLFNWLIGILSNTSPPGPGRLWSPPSSSSSLSPCRTQTQTQTTPPTPPPPLSSTSARPCVPDHNPFLNR
ncbi:uncharacterized protein LY79DRAFT_246481 [Colletotrichum navitas]|uniref:Uncharacterized protein n=1 Tax=Colletotrichum navitas TaxID=681940 RepID=A0AAD8QCK2_9PEZI|nr:uncharacterized protein LY79DRAFT_246481 [Colletotrichum navitas]KAK1598514.1 hypothetical protein LY79DRAFT_246481 [Colletotrichum navitas]